MHTAHNRNCGQSVECLLGILQMILDASEDLAKFAKKHGPESLHSLNLFLSIRIYTAQRYKAKPQLCAPGICCCTWHGAARWLIRSLASEV